MNLNNSPSSPRFGLRASLLAIGLWALCLPSCSRQPEPSASPVIRHTATPLAVASQTPQPGDSPTLTPEEQKTRRELRGLVTKGMDQILLSHHQESLPFLEAAYQIDPTDGEVHYWKFKAYQALDPHPSGLDAPGPFSARQVILYSDLVSWRSEAEEYLDTIQTAAKSAAVSVQVAMNEEALKAPPPPPPPSPEPPPELPKLPSI